MPANAPDEHSSTIASIPYIELGGFLLKYEVRGELPLEGQLG
jgi:hypothetical protein